MGSGNSRSKVNSKQVTSVRQDITQPKNGAAQKPGTNKSSILASIQLPKTRGRYELAPRPSKGGINFNVLLEGNERLSDKDLVLEYN